MARAGCVTARHGSSKPAHCGAPTRWQQSAKGCGGEIVARGIPDHKVTVIANAVDRNAFRGAGAPDPALAARLGLGGKRVLGFFGSFYSYEGLHLLLRAVPLMQRRRSDIAVLLVGGGPEEDGLRALASELGLGCSAVFTGRVPHDEIGRYYDLADMLVFPRLSLRLTELVTPLKPLEAMAQERIVVASNVGGHRELIRDRETGYLFPPTTPNGSPKGCSPHSATRHRGRASGPPPPASSIPSAPGRTRSQAMPRSMTGCCADEPASAWISGRGAARKFRRTARSGRRSCSASRTLRHRRGSQCARAVRRASPPIAAASEFGPTSETMRPAADAATMSPTPAKSDTTAGVPQAMLSSNTLGQPSWVETCSNRSAAP